MPSVVPSRHSIEFKSGPRLLLFNVNRLVQVEEHYGSLTATNVAVVDHPSSATRYLLWVGTGMDEEGMPETAAGDLADGVTLRWAMDQCTEAINEAIGGSGEAGDGDPTLPTPPTPGPSS